jgi:hypothetical protein
MLNTVATKNAIIQMENFQMHHFDKGKHFKTDGKVPSNRLHFRHRRLSRYVLIKMGKIYSRLEAYQRTHLACLGQQIGVSASSQLVHRLCSADCETKLNFVNWYIQGLYDGELNFGFCAATLPTDFQTCKI